MPQLIASVEGVEVKHVFLHKDRTTLGRKPDNDIVFDNLVVSGRHCVFDLVGLADVWLEDQGSTNGTFVNNRKIRERTRLHDGDVVAIGQFRIKYLQASEQPSGFGETASMRLDAGGRPAAPQASFQVLTGTSAGLEVPVVKAVTTFGHPGVAVVSVSHRRTGFFVAQMAGQATLNGVQLGDTPVLLSQHDVLELAGTKMLFQLSD